VAAGVISGVSVLPAELPGSISLTIRVATGVSTPKSTVPQAATSRLLPNSKVNKAAFLLKTFMIISFDTITYVRYRNS
jgi:hypothetical protein